MQPPPDSLPSRRTLGVVALLGYVAIAHAVQQLYPFSVFDMYAHQATSASRLGVREPGGALSEVTAWVDWRCDGPLRVDCASDKPGEPDPHVYSIPYRDREAQEWLDTHRGPGEQPIELVRHIWWLQPVPGQAEIEDRVVLHCRARRP